MFQPEEIDRAPGRSETSIQCLADSSTPQAIQRVADNLCNISPPDWLVRSLIETQTIGTIFGETNVGKSAIAVDVACRVACGLPFAGERTKEAPVLYVAQEGRRAFKRRFRAWELHNNQKLPSSLYETRIDVRIPDKNIERQLSESVEWLYDEHGTLALVILDTASTTMIGDQKHGADMNAFLAAIKRLFSESSVMLIHHPGHGDKSRGRGASELPAACDWEFKLQKVDHVDKVVRLQNTKQRDAALHCDIHFQLLDHSMGLDAEQEEYGSVVVDYLPEYNERDTAKKTPSPTGQQMLRVLNDLLAKEKARLKESNHNPDNARVLVDDWRAACDMQGIKSDTYRGLKARLLKCGSVIIDGSHIYVPDA